MPAETRGSVYKVKDGWGIRWPEDGERKHKSPFPTKTAARRWFDDTVAPRLRRGGPSADITLDAFIGIYLDRWGRTVSEAHARHARGAPAPQARARAGERCRCASCTFGDWTLAELEGAAADVAAWRAAWRTRAATGSRRRCARCSPPPCAGGTSRATRRSTPGRTRSRARRSCARSRARRSTRSRPSSARCTGRSSVFAAETGLRTNEWTAVERRDIARGAEAGGDRAAAVQRRRADAVPEDAAPARAAHAARARRRRRVPPRLDTKLLFPAAEGGHINLDNWRTRDWYPALEAAGVDGAARTTCGTRSRPRRWPRASRSSSCRG
jgi:hypothetical protein